MEEKNITGLRIKQLRNSKRLTQKELAELVKVSPQVISNWERGYTPGIAHDDLSRLASALDTSTDYLSGISDERKSSASAKPIDDPEVINFMKTVVGEFQLSPYITPQDRQEIMEDLAEYFYFKLHKKKKQHKD